MELPKIISVDDHVVEPPHLWQKWLPAKHRERGPRIEQFKIKNIKMSGPAIYDLEMSDDGDPADCWIYDDRVVYVHKRHVAIPKSATPGGDPWKFDKHKMTLESLTYEDMRPGCYQIQPRIEDMALCGVEASLGFPTMPRFCGQTFLEAEDHELALACVKAYNDWMVEEWCGESDGHLLPLCLVPLWDAQLAAEEVRRNAARGCHALAFSEIPPHLGLPSIHTGYWDPMFEACAETSTTVCMHIGSSSKMPATSADAPLAVSATLSFNNAMASLSDFLFSGLFPKYPGLRIAYSEGQIGWLPYVLERADDVWKEHEGWMKTSRTVPEPPSTYYHGHVFGCFFRDRHGLESLHRIGVDNVTFETDYPHSDTTWPHTQKVVEEMFAGLDEVTTYKLLRGNAIDMLSLERDKEPVTA
jgi:predicted TIM-barrel fold metal-dependent hydrolase